MAFDRLLTNICADDLAASRDFFVELLGLEVVFDSDWYIQLRHPDKPEFELGIIERTHELVPEDYRRAPTGAYLTFVVSDVEVTYERAQAMGASILQPPRDEFYGQRRFLAVEPGGCLVDVCSPAGG